MDKVFKQLGTQVFDLCNYVTSNSVQSAFKEFEAKYTKFKQLFLALREKYLKYKKKEKKSNITSCERSLEEKRKKKCDTFSIDKHLREIDWKKKNRTISYFRRIRPLL